jgi:hypothetical protein
MYVRALLQAEPLKGYYVLTMQRATKTRHREEEVLEEVIASRMQPITEFLTKIRHPSVGQEYRRR